MSPDLPAPPRPLVTGPVEAVRDDFGPAGLRPQWISVRDHPGEFRITEQRAGWVPLRARGEGPDGLLRHLASAVTATAS